MPLAAVGLLLAAAASHATWNYFAKGARNDLAFTFGMFAVSAVIYLPVLAVALVTYAFPDDPLKGFGFAGVTAFLHLLYYFLLTRGYSIGDLSLVYPLARGTGPMLAVAGAIVLYGERPGPLPLAGAALIIGGIIVMSWPRATDASRGIGATIGFALATGACTAAYTLWDKRGVEHLDPLAYGCVLQLAGAAILTPLALATRERRAAVVSTMREQRTSLLAIGALMPGAYILVLAALAISPVSYVAPAREISILIGALLGWRLLRESEPTRRLLGASAMAAGIFALAAG